MEPFIVTSGKHRFKFIPEEGGYSVSAIGLRGVNTQGDTFEEALANAREAAELMEEFRAEIAGGRAKPKAKAARSSARAKAAPRRDKRDSKAGVK